MLHLLFLFCLVSANAMDSTKVSRIKPTYLNYQVDGRSGLSTHSPFFMSSPNSGFAQETTPSVISSVPRDVSRASGNPIREMARGLKIERKTCEKPYSCVNCTAFKLCAPSGSGYTEIFSSQCPGDRPYCDNYSGSCVNTIEAAVKCAAPDYSFHCLQDGYFPHPEDATKYFICSDLNAYGYSCQEGFKYYAPSQECVKFSWISNPFDCIGLNASKVAYNNGGSYFAYCVNGKPFLVNTCGEKEIFNVSSQVCEPSCNDESTYVNSNDCKSYFKCFKSQVTNLFEKVLFNCPPGDGFNGTLRECVPLSKLSPSHCLDTNMLTQV